MKSDTYIQKSIIVKVEKQDVVDEYQWASRHRTAYERAVWGSSRNMLGRFRWALRELNFAKFHRWLDVGCGEADFFVMAEEAGHRFEHLSGIDLTPAMIERAREKQLTSPSEFHVVDMEQMPDEMTGYDFMNMLGVLQKCGLLPEAVFHTLAPRLNEDGLLYLTSTNLLWSQFSEGYLQPEVGHSWFNPYEVAEAAEAFGLRVFRMGGLIPNEVREVSFEESPTFFMLLQKVNGRCTAKLELDAHMNRNNR
jgi:SAM-dependent methyltransferase